MKIILFQPQIPPNTGNIVRTCAVTGCDLVLVRPLGFAITDRWLKRAGLDYWEGVNVNILEGLNELITFLREAPGQVHLLSSKGTVPYTQRVFGTDDWFIFGSETAGLPEEMLRTWKEHVITIPMLANKRCLNLSSAVGIVIYEAWRQQGFFKSFEVQN